ncbi:S-layer homology domain-containing protein [Bacillus cereus]|nr:S-layer homology domain-containing protein [Bacillus cereus]MEC2757684.1 S-layer homology domain-containing protein [Bacillus cereus]MEC2830440.1 S-layer homology domain-containing protein [Bacillus cereus]
MKKIMKILYIIPILIGMIFIGEKSSFAAENEKNIIAKEEAQRKAAIYVQAIGKQSYPNWINSNFSESKTLRDLDGRVKGYLFQIQKDNQDYGYIIVNSSNKGSSIIESTKKGNNPYKEVPEGQAVYVGPLQYLKKEGNKISSLKTNEIEQKNIVQFEEKKQNLISSSRGYVKENIPNNIPEDIYRGKSINNVPDYTWYRGCSPTAFANLVAYWSQQGFPNLLKNNESEHQFINNLGDVMGTTPGTYDPKGNVIEGGATSINNMVPGLNKYWNSRGYSMNAELIESPSFERFKQEIDANRPFVITILPDSPLYKGAHSVTAVGYEELQIFETNETFRTFVVHDTWSSTPLDVSLDYDEYLKYIHDIVVVNPFSFIDVPKGHWAYNQIMYMVGNKIMTGYGNGYFGAQDNMTREQLAAFLYRYLKPIDTNENPYVDIHDSPFKKEITALTKRRIFTVNAENKFNPKSTATRAEIASVLTKAFNLKIKANYEFNDMKGHWANEYVKALYSNGIANGIGNKNFGPSANVTREQMAMFLYRAINLDPNYIPVPI